MRGEIVREICGCFQEVFGEPGSDERLEGPSLALERSERGFSDGRWRRLVRSAAGQIVERPWSKEGRSSLIEHLLAQSLGRNLESRRVVI